MKIYVASSWRNERQPEIVKSLREAGHEVYDFREPAPGERGFHWSDIDPAWKEWTPEQFRESLQHPIATHGVGRDLAGMAWADAFLLLMPCGRSAHLELGWAIGQGKLTLILLSDGEPELMYALVHHLCVSMEEVLQRLDWDWWSKQS